MTVEEYSQLRIEAVLDIISELSNADFPYSHSKAALKEVKKHFKLLQKDLRDAIRRGESDMVRNLSTTILEQIFAILPVIGFILRSTNVRNAFEVHGPLLRMARRLLSNDTKLLLSSEWDYSPYTYRPIASLRHFVLIGLPATESSNPLVLPLAGHELGHSIWKENNLESEITIRIRESVLTTIRNEKWAEFKALFPGTSDTPERLGSNVFDQPAISTPAAWASYQAQESFCDFLGLKLFGTSYLFAFAYLLAPGTRARVAYYPSFPTRLANLKRAAECFTVSVPEGFDQMAWVYTAPVDWGERDRFLVALADAALRDSIDAVIDLAESEVLDLGVVLPTDAEAREIVDSYFSMAVPCQGKKGLADILNAAWLLQADESLWMDPPSVTDKKGALRDVVLKSIEILEFEERNG